MSVVCVSCVSFAFFRASSRPHLSRGSRDVYITGTPPSILGPWLGAPTIAATRLGHPPILSSLPLTCPVSLPGFLGGR